MLSDHIVTLEDAYDSAVAMMDDAQFKDVSVYLRSVQQAIGELLDELRTAP